MQLSAIGSIRSKSKSRSRSRSARLIEPADLFSAMAPSIVHLPNGQTVTVSPVFAGLSFKANDLNIHHSIFPPGWTIVLESEHDTNEEPSPEIENDDHVHLPRRRQVHRFKTPTLHHDNLFISSISNPSNTDFKPATSPTRQIAMMLWVTLSWYFHQVSRSDEFGSGRY